MKHYTPALSSKMPEFGGGSTTLPLQPRVNGRDIVVETIGGLPTTELADTKKKYYYVVNSMGTPVKNGEVSYLAASPSSAATSAMPSRSGCASISSTFVLVKQELLVLLYRIPTSTV